MSEHSNEYRSAAEAAAAWWAEQVGGFVVHDNGDKSQHGFIASALGGLLADEHPVTPEQVERFRVLLLAAIEHARERHPSDYCGLHTDYGPDPLLGDSAREAGIDASRFPWKTNSWVWSDKFEVSAGYGAPTQTIWRAGGEAK